MKTSELTGAALDWAVGRANKWVYEADTFQHGNVWWDGVTMIKNYHPSANWAQGGPIIERENIGIFPRPEWPEHQRWSARSCGLNNPDTKANLGPTPLIAAMRAYVASKLGDEVEIPEELE